MQTQMKKVEVLRKPDLQNGQMKEIETEGHKILVAKVADKYYAAQARCPHLGGILANGKLEGTVVTCPLHGSQFDLVDGRVIRWTRWTGALAAINRTVKKPRPLKIYKVPEEEDKIFVEL